MSSDLYCSELPEKEFGSMIVEMKVSGLLKFIVEDFLTTHPESSWASFRIPATQDGIKEAEKIISTLQSWIDHIKESEIVHE